MDKDTLPDNKIIVICDELAVTLGILCSQTHLSWADANKGQLEDRPVYVKQACFDPFPFPDATPSQRDAISELAEELDATRKAAIAELARLVALNAERAAEEKAGTVRWLRPDYHIARFGAKAGG